MYFIAAALVLLILLLAAILFRLPLVSDCFPLSAARRRLGYWRLPDAIAIVGVWFFLPGLLFPLCDRLPKPPAIEKMSRLLTDSSRLPPGELERLSREHPLTQVFVLARRVEHGGWLIASCFLVGCLLVTVTEEFFFRVVLQRTFVSLLSPPAESARLSATVLTALLVASVHIRGTGPIGPETFTHTATALLTSVPLGAVLTLLFGWLWLRLRYRRGAEVLFRIDRDPRLIGRGLLAGTGAFLLFLPTLILLQIGFSRLFPGVVTDPIPLFFFALFLGILADRSGRLAPSVGMHMSLNCFSFFLLAAKSCA
ncbi:MAG: CPBP family intramembrane metalloprotease [Thermoguttaceae bacterium]|nr:CPBP family intramembrane metalloprotease [Thermoguttaceae bacterium]